MRAPFVFGDDRRSLAELLESAGLVDVAVEARAGEVRFGSVEAFVRYQCAGSPLAAHVDPGDVRPTSSRYVAEGPATGPCSRSRPRWRPVWSRPG